MFTDKYKDVLQACPDDRHGNSCVCRLISTEDPIPTTNKFECLTTMEVSGFEDISNQSSTSEEHEETEKDSEKTEENQTIVQNIKSVNKSAENTVNLQKNVNNTWMNGINDLKDKGQEEKKMKTSKPKKSNLKKTAGNKYNS